MAATSLGLVGIVDKGDYNSATTYVKGNFVYHNYCSWLCKVASATGIEPTEQNNTTWQLLAKGINLATFIGATASTAGTGGAVPQPQAGDEGKALMGNGTWDYAGELSWTGTQAQWNALSASEKAEYNGKKVYITDDYMENIPVMIGASANDGGYKGLVPTPNAGDENKVLKGNGAWADLLYSFATDAKAMRFEANKTTNYLGMFIFTNTDGDFNNCFFVEFRGANNDIRFVIKQNGTTVYDKHVSLS